MYYSYRERIYDLLMKFIFAFIGIGMAVLSATIFIALITFDKSDPSFNLATSADNTDIHNAMGFLGSYTADLLFQSIGITAFLLCVVLFIWGNMFYRHSVIRLFWLKFIALLIFLPATSVLTGMIFFRKPIWWVFNSLGGFVGDYIIQMMLFIPNYITIALAFAVAILSLSVVVEITCARWKKFFRGIVFVLRKVLKSFAFIYHKITSQKVRAAIAVFFSKIKFRRKAKVARNEEEDEFEAVQERQRKKRIAATNASKQPVAAVNPIIKRITDTINYMIPSLELLVNKQGSKNDRVNTEELKRQSDELSKVLSDFGVRGAPVDVRAGPVITLHEFEPAAGTKSSRVIGLADDIARSMSAISARISTVSGRNAIGIELPNAKRQMIYLRELFETNAFKNAKDGLPLVLGKAIDGSPVIADLAKMPHLLIAGTTGSGKSVAINTMILSLLYKFSPEECKFIMVDPKMLELSAYEGIPHLLTPVVTEPSKAVAALKWVTSEMEDRYRAMSALRVRNLENYNEKVLRAAQEGKKLSKTVQTGFDPETGEPIMEEVELNNKPLPLIVVIIDEMADLMLVAGKDVEISVQRLAQMARAAGIHIVMATQRPSVDVITGVIKANFPTRISFHVTSKIDSRTILGEQGAEQLLGKGDMLFMSGSGGMQRVHGPFVSDEEVEAVVSYIKAQGTPEYIDSITEGDGGVFGGNNNGGDMFSGGSPLVGYGTGPETASEEDLYRQAVKIVRQEGKASTSYVQRQLRIGYNRAANLIERMEQEGIVSPPGRNGKREVLEG